MSSLSNIRPYNTLRSTRNKGQENREINPTESPERKYHFNDPLEKVSVVREGIDYGVIEYLGKRINRPVKFMLGILDLPQTTYNKKKSENALLNSRDTELILSIHETIDLGMHVFNQEADKFLRWLQKPNPSLGGNAPESFLDTISGILEIKNVLYRLEHGNLA